MVPPNVSANPALGLVAALGMYETNGLTANEDWPAAAKTGESVSETAAMKRTAREDGTRASEKDVCEGSRIGVAIPEVVC